MLHSALINLTCCVLEVVFKDFKLFTYKTFEVFSDINKLKSLVMSKESPFEIMYILTDFFQFRDSLGARSMSLEMDQLK